MHNSPCARMTIFTALSVPGVPRTVGILQPFLLLIGIGLSRLGIRYWLGDAYQRILHKNMLAKVLIYGAGKAGRQLAAALTNSAELNVVGYLDDDPRLKGGVMLGQGPMMPVLAFRPAFFLPEGICPFSNFLLAGR